MKKLNAKKIMSIVFVCLTIFFMGAIGTKLVMTKVFHIYPETNAAEGQPDETENPTYDWTAEYPFSGDYGFTYTAETDEVKENTVRVSPIKSFENSVREILLSQIDLLYEVFMNSSLPQYEKDRIGEMVAAMKKNASEESETA